MTKYMIFIGAAIAVAVIVIIVLMLRTSSAGKTSAAPQPAAAKFIQENGVSYINNTVMVKSSSADGNVQYLGEFPTQAACEAAVALRSEFAGYTWHDATQGAYANQGYGVKNIVRRDKQSGKFSAYRA